MLRTAQNLESELKTPVGDIEPFATAFMTAKLSDYSVAIVNTATPLCDSGIAVEIERDKVIRSITCISDVRRKGPTLAGVGCCVFQFKPR